MNRRDFFKRLIAATAVLPLVSRLQSQPAAQPTDTWPELNFIDLPPETGDIIALVPHGDSVLAFTERALYRIDYVGQPWRFDGRRFRSAHMDFTATRVVKQRYL